MLPIPRQDRTEFERGSKSFCEFFAGIGLVHEGLVGSGWRCTYANDIDPKKRQLYEARFGPSGHFHQADVWNTAEVAAHIPHQPFLATASFPCVDLSVAGHYRGIEGKDSSAFFGFAKVLRALSERRPPLVLVENVTGFITSRNGEDFATATRHLAELGYWLDAFVVDAENFVPQSRPRVFLVGVSDACDIPSAVRQSKGDWLTNPWQVRLESNAVLRPPSLARLMTQIELDTGWALFDLPAPPRRALQLADVIDRDDAQEWWPRDEVDRHLGMMSDRHRALVAQHVADQGSHVGTIYRRVRQGSQRAEVRFDGVAGCLRTPRGGSAKQIVIVVDAGRVRMRWMSPREYARLQGVGDFPLVGSRIQQLFGFGDAVCVPVIRWIDQHVLSPVFDAAQRTAPRKKPTPTRAARPRG